MQKVLNQEQIDEMFRAMRKSGGPSAPEPKEDSRKIVSCNLRQSTQLSKEHVRAINSLNEVFARNLTRSLGAYLRILFETTLVSVEQLIYNEYFDRIPEMTYMGSLGLGSINAIGLLQLDVSLAFPIIDLLLGGEGKGNGKLRDLTEIENEILESVLKVICRELESAWEPLEMKLAFDSRQAPSQVQRIMPPNEKVLVLSFEVKMPDVRGNLNFAFPSAFSTALLKKLAKHWEYQKPHTTEQDGSRMRDLLQDCQFLLELGVECDRVPVRQLVSLKVGDIVKLPHSIRHPAKVFVAGKPMFEASPVRIGEGKGAQIMQLSPDPKAEANREKAFA